MSLSVLFPAFSFSFDYTDSSFLKEVCGQDFWGWISDTNSIFNIQTCFISSRFLISTIFDIKTFDNSAIWRQEFRGPWGVSDFWCQNCFSYIWQWEIDAKMDFQTIHVKEFHSFPKYYLKDLNCHKVGGGRAARRRRRKNVACFSKCRKWNFWRLERCCCLLLEENPSKQAGEINVVKLLELQGGIWNSSLSWLEPVHSMYRAPQQEISGDSDSYQNDFRWSKGSFRFINLKTFRAFRGFLCYKQIF